LNAEVNAELRIHFSIQPSAFRIASMRIIAGELKGRRLKAPDWEGLRPTSDKLRETLFNVLGPSVVGARVLDGYAGTGAIGIEALSRGAAHVTFVDNDRRAVALIKANLEHCGVIDPSTGLGASRYAIIPRDFTGLAAPEGNSFDIMVLDPPYGAAALQAALTAAARLASNGTRVIIEHAKRDPAPAPAGLLVLTRELISGESALAFYTG
jgi:16S rRNA (guanine966-N2)-methyltransferase